MTVDDIDWRRRYRVLLLTIAVLVAALLGAVVLRGSVLAPPATDRGRLADQLAVRVVEILEQPAGAGAAGADRQGHPLAGAGPGDLVCVARVFGFDPPDAAAADQVRAVYAYRMCAEVGPQFRWPAAVRAAGPVAVDLTEPVAVHRPEDALPGDRQATHADRVRAVIPERYHRPELTDPAGSTELAELGEELRRRFEVARDQA